MKLTKKKRERPEDAIQREIIKQCAILLKPEVIFFHVPNGGKRHPIEAAIMKGLGVLEGVPDLIFIGNAGRAHFIELKGPSGVLNEAQRRFRDRCIENCVGYVEARSAVEAIEALDAWCLTRVRVHVHA